MGKQSGFMMLVIALLLVVIAGLAASFVAMVTSGTNASISALSANYAYDLAQTGLEDGSFQLSLGTCSASWSSVVTIAGQGEYQYSCTQYTKSTTTTSALTASATTIPLTSVANMALFGAVTIDSEIVYYDGISGNNLLNARRGQNGTTPATHLLGATAIQAQYIISSQGGSPTLSEANGKVTLYQAVLLGSNMSYYAVGSNGSRAIILYYNGSSWSTVLTGQNGVVLRGIDLSSNYGQAVGYNGSNQSYIYAFNGTTWSLSAGPDSNRRYNKTSCDLPLNPNNCWIAGQNTSNSKALLNRSGSSNTSLTRNILLTGVSCSNGNCVSVGDQYAYTFLSSSASPFANENPTFSSSLTDVSCSQANSCVATQNSGKVYYYNGSSWSSYQLAATSLNSVHCPAPSMCVLVGNGGRIFNCSLPITGVGSCVAQASPGSLNLLGVRCNATDDCLAVGVGTVAYRFTSGTWTSISLPANYTLNAVAGVAGLGSGVMPIVFRNQ